MALLFILVLFELFVLMKSLGTVNTDTKCGRTDLISANDDGYYELTVCHYFDIAVNVSSDEQSFFVDRHVAVLHNGYTVILVEYNDILVFIYNNNGEQITSNQAIITFDAFEYESTAIVIPSNTVNEEFIVLWGMENGTFITEIKHATFNSNNIDETFVPITGSSDIYSFTPKFSESNPDLLYSYFDQPSVSKLSNNNHIVMFQESSSSAVVNVFDNDFNLLATKSYQVNIGWWGELKSLSISCITTAENTDICLCVWYKEGEDSCDDEPQFNEIKIVYLSDPNTVNISDVNDDGQILNFLKDDCNIYNTKTYSLPNNKFVVWWNGGTKVDYHWLHSMYMAMYDVENKPIINQTQFDKYYWEGIAVSNNGIIIGSRTNDNMINKYISYGNIWNHNFEPVVSEKANGSIILNIFNAFQSIYGRDYSLWDDILPEVYKIIPTETNDFIVINGGSYHGHDILFGVKVSVYSTCCDVQSENKGDDGVDTSILITVIIVVVFVSILAVILAALFFWKMRTRKQKNTNNLYQNLSEQQ